MEQTKTKLPSYDQALAAILPHLPPLSGEKVTLEKCLGRVLLEDVRADRDQPPFHRSAMDGFALRAQAFAAGKSFAVRGSVAAGAMGGTLSGEDVVRIATGAPLPPGGDTVIPIEQCVVEQQDGQEAVVFQCEVATPWQNVHRRASDANAGQVVIPAQTVLGPQHVGIAAAVGACLLPVRQLPRITLLSTGDEVRPPETAAGDLQPQQIRNSNAPMLKAFLAALGLSLLEHQHVPDEPQQTLAAAREALSHSHLVITVGGVSVGQRDFLPGAWQQLKLEKLLHGVAIQPGKPVFVARESCKLVLGLPGNPVSVLSSAHLFLWPLLRQMLRGEAAGRLPWRQVTLAQAVQPSSKREVFRAASLQDDGQARMVAWHGSGDLMHTAGAQGLLRLPLQDEPVPAGSALPYLPLVGCP